MGKVYQRIDDKITEWLARQSVFFVATAPLADDGHINLSPKGLDSLRVIDEQTLAYLDFGGSGIETIAHLRENGRIVLMVCAFEGEPKIFRFHGTGSTHFAGEIEFDQLVGAFDTASTGVRAIIKIAVDRISDSCGYGVPLMDFNQHREHASDYAQKNPAAKVRAYFKSANSKSIDGLPGLTQAQAEAYLPPSDRATANSAVDE